VIVLITVFIIALLIGVIQIVLETVSFTFFLGKKLFKGAFAVAAKLLLYGVGLYVLFKFLRASVTIAAIGFGVGFFVSLFVAVIHRIRKHQ
jgi:hypothetical protein